MNKIHLPRKNLSINKLNLFMNPTEIYERLYISEKYSFLYESLDKNVETGRFSILGGRPFLTACSKGENITIENNEILKIKDNPYKIIKELVASGRHHHTFPVFSGGAVGFISYDFIRFFEEIPDKNPDNTGFPDLFFIFPSEIFVVDHFEKNLYLIQYYDTLDKYRISEIKELLSTKNNIRLDDKPIINYMTNCMERNYFLDIVKKAKDYIFEGDIFQVVLSQRFEFKIENDPYLLYKKMRITNPSPYMYYQKFGDYYILGSSPETLVKLINRVAITRPIAGTRPRGKTPDEDKKLEIELINSEKERAEHIMLVDLGRNDLGRVCKPGTVKPSELMVIGRYSKVMHIVSTVEGELMDNEDAFSLFSACFPAGTVTGAPKIRAMEIIDELEDLRRSVYAGAVGYFDFNGNMDFCIAIRTIFINKDRGFIQAGAGIVADSDPEFEYQETINKLSALFAATNIDIEK